ncbi:hypothetical protein [Tahibacter soli]|uniref:Uncharacterized protein n=1 Tax=Tahibacter soli TaxID=2983605 RepID=A0A9X3YH06_9GAMM|nr:hypothetical protein [Tahibacter soli]MDC8010975.1 hypothetical protein [Tahibacter soli]
MSSLYSNFDPNFVCTTRITRKSAKGTENEVVEVQTVTGQLSKVSRINEKIEPTIWEVHHKRINIRGKVETISVETFDSVIAANARFAEIER